MPDVRQHAFAFHLKAWESASQHSVHRIDPEKRRSLLSRAADLNLLVDMAIGTLCKQLHQRNKRNEAEIEFYHVAVQKHRDAPMPSHLVNKSAEEQAEYWRLQTMVLEQKLSAMKAAKKESSIEDAVKVLEQGSSSSSFVAEALKARELESELNKMSKQAGLLRRRVVQLEGRELQLVELLTQNGIVGRSRSCTHAA